jgi:capsular polysaccharide biosynthesis protein
MGTKYYTRFLLQAVDDNEVDEYSGVVEVQAAKNAVIEPKEIEALLASSFDIESDQVQLLNWSPLH